MNRAGKIQSIDRGRLFSSFYLANIFLKIPIPSQDRTFFGFYFKKNSCVFKQFPFGFVNSMQHFNATLDQTVAKAREVLVGKGLLGKGHWVVRYVEDVLMVSAIEAGQVETLRCVFEILRDHG